MTENSHSIILDYQAQITGKEFIYFALYVTYHLVILGA